MLGSRFCVHVPGYNPNTETLTIISAPGADVLSISPYENEKEQQHHDKIQEVIPIVAEEHPIKNIFEGVQDAMPIVGSSALPVLNLQPRIVEDIREKCFLFH